MRQCYVVPGILGSELFTGSPSSPALLWLSYTRMALGQFVGLALDMAGAGPRPGDGLACFPGQPLPDYYGGLVRVLRQQLEPLGYTVRPWGYDWRLDLIGQGERLANDVRATATTLGPVTIVCHSQGGLVARMAWRSLVLSGQSDLVERIVTIGTPHRGCYGTALAWSGQDADMQLLLRVSNATSAVVSLIQSFVRPRLWSAADLVAVMATWPALYQLLPVVDGASEVSDPLRPAVYEASRWPEDRGVSQPHLTNAAGVWATALASPASLPPPSVMVCVAGYGVPTPHVLGYPDRLGTVRAWTMTDQGDGRVPVDSALVPGYTSYRVAALHGDLQQCGQVLNNAAKWATEVLAPTPPAAGDIPGDLVHGRPGPPAAAVPWTNVIGDC